MVSKYLWPLGKWYCPFSQSESDSLSNPSLGLSSLSVGRGLSWLPLKQRRPVCFSNTTVYASHTRVCTCDCGSEMDSGHRGTYLFWWVPSLTQQEIASPMFSRRGMWTRVQRSMKLLAVNPFSRSFFHNCTLNRATHVNLTEGPTIYGRKLKNKVLGFAQVIEETDCRLITES